MEYSILGRTGLRVSRVSFGASSLGGVFQEVTESDAIRAVHAALDAGINYIDVAPAYGGRRAEAMLGKALRGVPRDRYFLSTKIGKYTNPAQYGDDTLDYSDARTRASLEESAALIGTDYFDIVHLHDIEHQGRRHTEWALDEGFSTLHALKSEGRIGAVGVGIYPMDLWHRILSDYDIDAAIVHNHYCLIDTRMQELLPLARAKSVGLINAAPFAMGLLTERGPADWHPASQEERALCRKAAEFCQSQGTSLSKLAMQFSSQNPEIVTTMFSSADPEIVKRNIQWHEEPFDPALLAQVSEILAPVFDKQWDS